MELLKYEKTNECLLNVIHYSQHDILVPRYSSIIPPDVAIDLSPSSTFVLIFRIVIKMLLKLS